MEALEGLLTGLERLLNIFFRVGGGDKQGLKLGGGPIDALMQHLLKKPGKELGVGLQGGAIVCDLFTGKKQGPHGALELAS